MRRVFAVFMSVALVFGVQVPIAALAQAGADEGHSWYVAQGGSDAEDAPGTLEQPFATISHAISKMNGGDTVYVRAGTYREEISGVPSGSKGRPSTICAYNDEKVQLTGADVLGGWQRTERDANIWVADMPWDMSDTTELDEIGTGEDSGHSAKDARYDNLVFVGGAAAPEGRWPNATPDQFLDRDHYAAADRASGDSIVDADLPSGIDFSGAQVWVASGGGYQSQMADIESYEADSKRLRIKSNAAGGWMYAPTNGNYYYVTKSLKTLDSAGEWYKDTGAGKLYLYESDGVDPNTLGVQAQRRAHVVRIGYGKDGAGKTVYEPASYITISGIDTYLGGVAFSPTSEHCIFERAALDCLDHALSSQKYGVGSGILLSGTDNLVARCEIMHAYGSAVTVWGTRNSVVNNHIHDTGYEHHEEQAAIRIGGSGQLVSHNSVHHIMRQAVGGFFEKSVISYNDLYDCMRVSRDGGVVYFNFHDYGNSEFHHNWLHDTLDFPASHQQVGLYMDSFTTSLVVYRNVVFGIQSYEQGNRTVNNNGRHLTYQINPNSLNNVIVNNTFLNYRPTHLNFYPNHDISGTVYLNNIFQSMSFIDGPTYYPWRWYDQWDRRTQTSKGHVARDILKEMGAWFDQGHNMEGEFKGNTWPPIDNQWADVAGSDFTLVEGSEAVDAGCEIPGVTDGFCGSAPDLGAYERGGDTWRPGCDFARDFTGDLAGERALNDEIPYRNLLSNRGFEDFTAGGAGEGDDFDAWEEAGTPQVSASMSAWSGWGWVVKQGNRCAVLDSDGDALTQRVSGLKPNTAYRLGGYAFVAGDYVRPDRMTSAVTDKGEAVDSGELARLRRGNPMSLSGLRRLRFDNVNFGSGRDRIIVGLRNPQYFSDETSRQTVSVALGSADNVVGSYRVDAALSAAEGNWRWVTIELDASYTGSQDVYLALGGSSYSRTSLAGFFCDCPISADVIAISANTSDDSGLSAGTVTVSGLYKPFAGSHYEPHSTVVRTGSSGELDVTISKRGGELVGYADEIFLSELASGENFGSAEACSHVFKADTCAASWEWKSLEDTDYANAEHHGIVTLTCAECGQRVDIDAPVAVEEAGRQAVCRASYAVVGGVLKGEQTFPVAHYAVQVAASAHGTLDVAADARRGAAVSVTPRPQAGYEIVSLALEREGKAALDILADKRFTMPAAPVTLTAAFKPSVAAATVTLANTHYYTGKPITPAPIVTFGGTRLSPGSDYTLSYKNNTKRGSAQMVVTGTGAYVGSKTVTFRIVKRANPMTVRTKVRAVSERRLAAAKRVVKPIAVARAKGKVTYAKKGGSRYLRVAKKTGKVTVRRGTPEGLWSIRVKVKAAGNERYKAKTKTVTVQVLVT